MPMKEAIEVIIGCWFICNLHDLLLYTSDLSMCNMIIYHVIIVINVIYVI